MDCRRLLNQLYSEKLLDHFRNPRRAGVLAGGPVVDVENPACGDWLRLSVRIEAGRIADAAFQVKGCTASIACGSALAEWLAGRGLADLRQMDQQALVMAVEDAVGGLPAASRHAAALCAEGVAALLERAP